MKGPILASSSNLFVHGFREKDQEASLPQTSYLILIPNRGTIPEIGNIPFAGAIPSGGGCPYLNVASC